MKRHTSIPLLTSLELVVGIEQPIPEGIAPVLEGGLLLRSGETEGTSNQVLDRALDMTACLVAAHHRLNGAWTGGQGKERSEYPTPRQFVLTKAKVCQGWMPIL